MSREWAIELGDIVDVLKDYEDNVFDAVCCDPPYGLSFMGKKWDYDVPNAELWREVLRVCKPGAPLIAFSGTRTYHRTVVQIEDAGWEIRDCVYWAYATGFPKSLDVSKAIDKDAGHWRGRAGAVVSDNPAMSGGNEGAAAHVDAQSGNRKGMSGGGKHKADYAGGMFGAIDGNEKHARGDSGGASRFFYVAKPARGERDAGCEDLPVMSGGEATDREDDSPGTQSPRAGAGRNGGARNSHPTVKPIALMTYLAKLLLPPKPGAILVPFSGSGSEMIGCLKAGWPAVVGIERESTYVEIAHRRLTHHTKRAA